MIIEFNKEEHNIIKKALIEYEENYYASEGRKWQNTINNLIEKIRDYIEVE